MLAIAACRGAGRARRVLGACLLAGLGAILLPGCVIYVHDGGESFVYGVIEEETRTSTLDHVTGSAVDVKTENGAVTIEVSDRKDVQVTAKLRGLTKERLEATKVLAERRDDKTLAIYVKWPEGGRKNVEGCVLEIKLPDAGGATVRASNGALKLTGVKGKADLKTSNGTIKVSKHTGSLKLDTSNGSVTVEDASGPVEVDTSNRPINVTLRADNAGPVNLDTSNGDVSLTVGKEFSGTLKVNTSNGSISLPPEGAARVLSTSKGKAKVAFKDGGKDSSIDTSNGSVTVKIAD